MSITVAGTAITFNDSTVQTTAAVAAASVIGLSQTYQNLTASRVNDTTYTNSTGKGIYVAVYIADAGGQPSRLNMFVGGVQVGATNMNGPAGYAGFCFTLLVPNGSTYRINWNASAVFGGWWELR